VIDFIDYLRLKGPYDQDLLSITSERMPHPLEMSHLMREKLLIRRRTLRKNLLGKKTLRRNLARLRRNQWRKNLARVKRNQ